MDARVRARPDDLGVPIAVSIVLDGSCEDFLGFGCLFGWAPDIDAELVDPTGELLDVSVCAAIESGDPSPGPCAIGRQETLHAMPSVAGTYRSACSRSAAHRTTDSVERSTSTCRRVPWATTPRHRRHHHHRHPRSMSGISMTCRSPCRPRDGVPGRPSAYTTERTRRCPASSCGGGSGRTGRPSCTTGATGACTLKRDLKRTRLSIEFVVVGLSKEAHTYLGGSNHDADGEQQRTKIVVTRP